MEKKFSVADFATLVGTTSKTIYQKIDNYDNLPVNEQLTTVKEKVKGREITFIKTTEEQIAWYQNLYGKNTVNEGEYYENVTNNNSSLQVNNGVKSSENNYNKKNDADIFERLMTLNETYLNRIETVTNELMEYKSKALLLEDKAGREGLYLKEINELKTDNEKLKTRNKTLFTVLTVLITVLVTVLITVLTVNNTPQDQSIKKEPAQIEQVQKPQVNIKK